MVRVGIQIFHSENVKFTGKLTQDQWYTSITCVSLGEYDWHIP